MSPPQKPKSGNRYPHGYLHGYGFSAGHEILTHTRTRKLSFTISQTNYIDFLHAALTKHNQGQFKITEAKRYAFKYVIDIKRKVSDAMDVDNAGDYKEMVKKINDERPTIVKIFIDMKDVEKLPRGTKPADEDETGSTDDEQLMAASGSVSDLDLRLARWRTMLEKKYWNDHGNGLTYVGPLGVLTLTPAMILDWCRALKAGKATLSTPPNIDSFNIAHKALALHPARKAMLSAPPPTPAIDVNALTSVLLLQTLTKSGLIPTNSTENLLPPTPMTPTPLPSHNISKLSPIVHTPTQLSRFLKHAEKHLGVSNATSFKAALHLQDIGPDILPDVSDQTLKDAGMSTGDII
ncbi:hypothetical protein BU15DRAFT_67972 [Melanogaster broomeanus]|nr:hypothetical protein BU15DRAFT_67972 [Melanogaster broomeanus]